LLEPLVKALSGQLDAVEKVGERKHSRERDAERRELRRRHLRPAAGEHRGVDVALREADGEEADRNQDDTEQRVDSAEVLALRAGLDGVSEHEIGRIEEKEHEEEDELTVAPDPPVIPADFRPE